MGAGSGGKEEAAIETWSMIISTIHMLWSARAASTTTSSPRCRSFHFSPTVAEWKQTGPRFDGSCRKPWLDWKTVTMLRTSAHCDCLTPVAISASGTRCRTFQLFKPALAIASSSCFGPMLSGALSQLSELSRSACRAKKKSDLYHFHCFSSDCRGWT